MTTTMRVKAGVLASLLVAGAAFAARAPSPAACMTARPLSVRAPLFALATAGADTVRAGPGPIRYEAGDTTGLESIHGQRFRLDALGGDVPAAGAPGAGAEVVLVPYGWECGESWRWREARWAGPGAQLFVDLSLRPREMWAGGLPTFDVEVVHDWYPESYTAHVDAAEIGEMLPPAQVFAINQLLPTSAQVEAAPDSAYAPLLAWAGANPAPAARFPATGMLDEAFETLQPCVPAYDRHPVAGTYRATVVVEGRDTLHTFLRTDAAGSSECGPAPRLEAAVVRPRTADSTRLYVHGAADTAAIPETNGEAWNGATNCGVGSVVVLNRPRAGEGGRRSWRGDYNYLALPACFRDRPAVKAASEALFAAYRAGARDPQPGWFVEEADGMRFEQVWRAHGRVLLELRAVRVSPRTLASY